VAALVADFVDRSHRRHPTRVLRLQSRIGLFMRLARLSCAAASDHFEPDELLDLQGVQILQLIVFSVVTDTWGRDIPPLHHLGWMKTFREASRAWLWAEHLGLEPRGRRPLRTIARQFGWHWDPNTPNGSWYWEPARERFSVQEPPMQNIPLPAPGIDEEPSQ
jgi:hypothetical protein